MEKNSGSRADPTNQQSITCLQRMLSLEGSSKNQQKSPVPRNPVPPGVMVG